MLAPPGVVSCSVSRRSGAARDPGGAVDGVALEFPGPAGRVAGLVGDLVVPGRVFGIPGGHLVVDVGDVVFGGGQVGGQRGQARPGGLGLFDLPLEDACEFLLAWPRAGAGGRLVSLAARRRRRWGARCVPASSWRDRARSSRERASASWVLSSRPVAMAGSSGAGVAEGGGSLVAIAPPEGRIGHASSAAPAAAVHAFSRQLAGGGWVTGPQPRRGRCQPLSSVSTAGPFC